MDVLKDHDAQVEEGWRDFLEKGELKSEIRQRRLLRYLPTEPRCKFCNAPFHGPGGLLVRVLLNKGPSRFSPRLCNVCEHFAAKLLLTLTGHSDADGPWVPVGAGVHTGVQLIPNLLLSTRGNWGGA